MAPKKGSKIAPAPLAQKKKVASKNTNPLFEAKARNFGIGGDIQPKRDLGRFVKWPKYIRLQRQRAILMQRLKVPPTLNQFSKCLDKHTTSELLRLSDKYRPETRAQKKERLTKVAEAKAAGTDAKQAKPAAAIKFGLNHITALIEKKKAKLVVIAADVEPVELVLWLPSLCRKMGVPYCIVKGKARLGALIHQKKTCAIAFTDINSADAPAFNKIIESVNANFTEKWEETRRSWGGGIMGVKSIAATAKVEKSRAREAASRM
eukprot:CFRG5421T1